MKRFYCTICQKVKRVRKMPKRISNEHDTVVKYRQGVCNWHTVNMVVDYDKLRKMGA